MNNQYQQNNYRQSGPRRLMRPVHNRMIGGVCSGLAEYFNVDATLVRVIYVVATLVTAFTGIVAYGLMCLIIPEKA